MIVERLVGSRAKEFFLVRRLTAKPPPAAPSPVPLPPLDLDDRLDNHAGESSSSSPSSALSYSSSPVLPESSLSSGGLLRSCLPEDNDDALRYVRCEAGEGSSRLNFSTSSRLAAAEAGEAGDVSSSWARRAPPLETDSVKEARTMLNAERSVDRLGSLSPSSGLAFCPPCPAPSFPFAHLVGRAAA